ncbi:UGT76C4 [Symbiodinium necroappetens]|uniref:UGT76C4 protein n=1 Tax=Symbiodinium necroappetens TaxID=1628268 RepID=A0A813CF53_9DINO|nr:UGT76C4 [Symbiodinium necroappetens]
MWQSAASLVEHSPASFCSIFASPDSHDAAGTFVTEMGIAQVGLWTLEPCGPCGRCGLTACSRPQVLQCAFLVPTEALAANSLSKRTFSFGSGTPQARKSEAVVHGPVRGPAEKRVELWVSPKRLCTGLLPIVFAAHLMTGGPLWEVIGGSGGGGILVREGEKLSSAELPLRLANGAIIRQKELKGERLHFELVGGTGPNAGWVSLKVKGRELLRAVPKEGLPWWLNPSRVKGTILFLSIPWKGHIVHLRRIGLWFVGRPGFNVHFACFPEDEAELKKLGFTVHVTEGDERVTSEFFQLMEDGFREVARNPGDTEQEEGGSSMFSFALRGMAQFVEKAQDPLASYFSFCFRTLCAVKPDVVVCDNFCSTTALIPAWCHAEGVSFVPVQSPGIPEDHSHLKEGKPKSSDPSKELPPEVMAKATGLPVEVIKALNEGKDPSQLPQANSQNMTLFGLTATIQSIPPEFIGMMTGPLAKKLKLPIKVANSVLKNLPNATYLAELYPSTRSVVGQQENRERSLFTSPLLPLPVPLENGELQRDRETFKATLSTVDEDLLQWLFSDEEKGPVVYVAFGSIVRPNQDLLRKLAEALDGGDEWRVLWVLPEELQQHLPHYNPGRWRVEKFVPQADVLKSNRVRCFLSHMGANSTTESLVCGVPMMCCPFYMDQYEWTKTVCEHLGAGLMVRKASPCEEIRETLRSFTSKWASCSALASMAFRPLQRALALRRLRWPGRPGTRSLAVDHNEEDDDTSGLQAPDSNDAAGGGHDAAKKEDDDDHVELMEWQSPWPFLSAADGKLCDLSAGALWPWKPSMASKLKEISQGVRPELQSADLSVDAMLAGVGSDVDLAVVARAAADGHQEDLWDWLNDRKAQLKKCNTGSLAAILSSLTRASQSAQRSQTSCRSLLRHVAGEMLQAHRRLSPRHALVMLASLKGEAQGGNTDDDEKPVSANDLLEKVFVTLNQRKDGDGRLLLAEIVPAMEALAVLRSTTVDAQREQLLGLATLLVGELHGGLGLSLLLAQSGQSRGGIQSALLRLLAALAHLPEAAGPTAKGLTALGGVRWSREAITSQEVMASAAFTLSRWGAWSSVRTDYLLSQASNLKN